jgi:hypothetical protein
MIDWIGEVEAHVRLAFQVDYSGEMDVDILKPEDDHISETIKFIFKNGRVMSAFRMKLKK